jgi:hypothetical protein
MDDELDVLEDARATRGLTARGRAAVAVSGCAVALAVVAVALPWGRAAPVVASSGGLIAPMSSAPTASSGGWTMYTGVPEPTATDACGCPALVTTVSPWDVPPEPSAVDPTTLATASYPQSAVSIGPPPNWPSDFPSFVEAWPQIAFTTGPLSTRAEAAPVDAHGSPVFPTAQLGQIQAVEGSSGQVAFVFVTLTTQAVDAQHERVVAHVRIYDRAGGYSFKPSDFSFAPAGDLRRSIEPVEDPALVNPLQPSTLDAGQSASGDVLFDVPTGGGDLYLTEWGPTPTPSVVRSTHAPGTYLIAGAAGLMLGPWHTDS